MRKASGWYASPENGIELQAGDVVARLGPLVVADAEVCLDLRKRPFM
jgi:hypothetical protein